MLKIAWCRITSGAVSALSLSSAYKASVFFKISPCTPIFFHLKSFLEKSPLTGIFGLHQFLFSGTCTCSSSFCKKSYSRNKPNTNVNPIYQFLLEKKNKNCNQECKQKQSRLFKFCNIFDLLTSRTEEIAW